MSGGNGSNGAPDEICYNLSTFAAPPPPDTRPAQGQGAIAPSPWRMSARMSLLSRPVAPSPRLDQLADAVGIVSLIGQHDGACAKVVEQAVDDLPIMRLTCGQAEPDREALRVDNDLDLGREPAARSTETMICTPPFCRRGLLVGANGGAVDHLDGAVVGGGDGVHQPVPDTCLSPAHEAVVAGSAWAIPFGQVAPRGTRSQHPEDAVQHSPVIDARHATGLVR